MLYKKSLKPFSDELFSAPTAEYRGAPFWGWNGALNKEELCRQIETFRQMGFGDITRQGLPFYGGNIIYHLPVTDIEEGTVLQVSDYKGAALRVAVDGKPLGQLCFAPYEMSLPRLPGEHSLDITLVGNRINTMGQLHCIPWDGIGWGPDTWRTTGDRWSYEYRFRAQGILKSPEILS